MPPNERSFSEKNRRGKKVPAREAKGGDKRDRILAAALRVFARKGFYATRVSEIATAAGVADGTIYLYFKNKDDVLISVFDLYLGTLIEVVQREVDATDDVEERIRRIVEVQLGLLEGQRDLAEVVTVNLRQSSRLLKQYAAPLFTQYLEVIAGVIADGQSRGVLRDDLSPRILSRALWGGLDGLALTWALGGGDADPGALRKAAQQYATLFLEGLRSRMTDHDRA